MAVTVTPVSSNLILVMDNGTGAEGQQLTKIRTYKNLKASAGNEDVYPVAAGLISLQEKNSLSIQRQDTVELNEV